MITCCVTVGRSPSGKGVEVCLWQDFLKDKKSCPLDSSTFRDSYQNECFLLFYSYLFLLFLFISFILLSSLIGGLLLRENLKYE